MKHTATVVCNVAPTVRIRAVVSTTVVPTATAPVRADGSVASKLTINNVDGATSVSAQVDASSKWPNINTLTSTLTTGAPKASALLGNAILIVDVP